MDDATSSRHIPYQPLENPTYIFPDFRVKEELLDMEPQNYPNQSVNLENPEEFVPIQSIKQELQSFEDSPYQPLTLESPTDILPIIPVKEDLLDFKEPDNLQDLAVSGGDTDQCDTDYKDSNLRDGCDESLMSLCEEETVRNSSGIVLPASIQALQRCTINCCTRSKITVHHHTVSPGSGMQLPLNVKPSSLTDGMIPSVQQYCIDTVKKRLCKKEKIATVRSARTLTGLHAGNTRTKPILQLDVLNISEKTLECNENKVNSCVTCHKCFSTPYNLKTHIEIHTGRKAYTCDTCHKSFNRLFDLKRHTWIHTGTKPYTCDICHKSFNNLGNLKTHTRIHTGNKPYTCDSCHECFSHLSNLKKHTRIHTGSKPYTCDTCHKCFSQISHLKTHSRIHTGSKPYICDTCHKCFSDLSNMKAHTRIHSGSKP